MVEAIYPYMKLVDSNPSRGSQLNSGESQRGRVVGAMLKSTINPSEKRLSSPISLADMLASRPGFRVVPRIHVGHWYSPLESFVFDEELGDSSLVLSRLGSVEDFHILSSWFKPTNNAFRVLYQSVSSAPVFLFTSAPPGHKWFDFPWMV